MPIPQHPWHVLHQENARCEFPNPIEVDVNEIIARIGYASALQAVRRKTLTGWTTKKQIAVFVRIEATSPDFRRFNLTDIFINYDRAVAVFTKILLVSGNRVSVEFDRDTHVQSSELRR